MHCIGQTMFQFIKARQSGSCRDKKMTKRQFVQTQDDKKTVFYGICIKMDSLLQG